MLPPLLQDQNCIAESVEKIAQPMSCHSLRAWRQNSFCRKWRQRGGFAAFGGGTSQPFDFRPSGLAGLALTTDTSALTAIGNDYSFENLFSRQVEALGRKGDVFIGISTSGKSPNILRAFEAARAKGIFTVGFTRDSAPMMEERCDLVLNIPSQETAKIQECHILFGHIICRLD